MARFNMFIQRSLSGIRFTALGTIVRLAIVVVQAHVYGQVGLLRELFAAHGAR